MPELHFQAVFYDGQTPKAHAARVQVLNRDLVVRYDGAPAEIWLLDDVIILQRPRDGLEGIIGNWHKPDQQLLVDDIALFRQLINRIPKPTRRRDQLKIPLAILSIMAAFVIAVTIIIPYFATSFAPLIPFEWEAKLGKNMYAQWMDGEQICSHPEGIAALHTLQTKLPFKHTIQLAVMRSDKANAFTLPGGYIVLLEGLIREAESPEEVAGILAHELGHVYHRHILERTLNTVGIGLMVDMFTGGGGTAIYATSAILQLSFSREQEAEADRYALTLLDQNHINPTRMADFFSRAAKTKEGKQWQEMLEFLSTHPAAQARMDDIRQWAAEQKTDYQPVLSLPEWDALKNICADSTENRNL